MIDSTKLIEFADADFEMLKELKHKEGEFVLHHNGYFDGFATGVKIGKTDTINKAVEQYEKELRQMKNILNTVKEGAGELISVGGSLIQFKKALEEK